jgi:hypothetical protein
MARLDSWRLLRVFTVLDATAGDGEKYFLEIGAAEALDELGRRLVGDNAAFSSMITLSARRSTSAMLWEASTIVAARPRQ